MYHSIRFTPVYNPHVQAHVVPTYQLPSLPLHKHQHLMKIFETNKNPQPTDLDIWATEVDLPVDQVKAWFENRLAIWRSEQGLAAQERTVTEFFK
ncbi:Uncharacterised protein g6771 [Pycnogonum litorale]